MALIGDAKQAGKNGQFETIPTWPVAMAMIYQCSFMVKHLKEHPPASRWIWVEILKNIALQYTVADGLRIFNI